MKLHTLCSFLIILFVFVGCANTTSTTYHYKDDLKKVSYSFTLPKDLVADELTLTLPNGTSLKAKKIVAVGNVEQTKAQGEREGNITGKLSEGITKGVVTGIKGF